MSYNPFDQSLIQDPREQRLATKFYDEIDEIRDPKDVRLFKKLKKKLLAIGGNDVKPEQHEHLALVARRGEFMDASKSRKVKGLRGFCHLNSVLRYTENCMKGRHTFGVASGYALDKERWLRHFWVVDRVRGTILETLPFTTSFAVFSGP